MLNVVALVGRMVADPELKYTPSGIAVCSFRVAVDRPFKSQSGEKQTDFIDIVAWRQRAEFAANYLTKGRLVSVQGRFQQRSWVQQDGQKRYKIEIVADQVDALDKPKEQQQQPPEAAAVPDQDETAQQPGAGDLESDMDYDPFAEE